MEHIEQATAAPGERRNVPNAMHDILADALEHLWTMEITVVRTDRSEDGSLRVEIEARP